MNKIKQILNNVMEWLGYNWVGYKVDIDNNSIDLDRAFLDLKDISNEIESISLSNKRMKKNQVNILYVERLEDDIKRLFEKINTLNNKVNNNITLSDERSE